MCRSWFDESARQISHRMGLRDGGRPTSELPSHLLNLAVKKRIDPDYRVVYHAHPANIIALTYVLPLNDELFTRELWQTFAESIF